VAPEREEALLRTSSFAVLIGDREVGFCDVGPLTSATDLEAPDDRHGHRFAPIVLRRALSSSTELYDWRRAILTGKRDRRDVTIRQLSAPGGSVVNSWRLVGAWPSRWSGPSFNALANDIAFEELELTFDDLLWGG
jgi:T4-like virus tail tube protein gp19